MTNPNLEIDWSATSWKGSRKAQHEAYLALPFRRKLEIIEALCDEARAVMSQRKAAGLPYRDLTADGSEKQNAA